jgi:hypothetical protein
MTSTIQEIIDENKEDIPDGVYLQLCELSLAQYKKTKSSFYEITYVYTDNAKNADEFCENKIFQHMTKEILQLTPKERKEIEPLIDCPDGGCESEAQGRIMKRLSRYGDCFMLCGEFIDTTIFVTSLNKIQ